MNNSLFFLLKSLWGRLSLYRHRQLRLLAVLTIFSAFSEVVSLGSVIPFIAAITQPEKVMEYSIVANFAGMIGITKGTDLVFPLAIAFGLAAIIAGCLRLFLVWATIQFGNGCGADLSIDLYKRTLFQPYSVHISRSSSEIISGITQKVAAITGVLTSVTVFITSIFLFVSIVTTLIIVDPIMALATAFSFGLAYILIAILTKKRLELNSSIVAEQQNQVVKSLQEGLGSIRDVLLDGSQNVYVELYDKAVNKVRVGFVQNAFINQFPRYAMESLGLVLIAIFVLVLNKSGNITDSLSILAFLALGAQRLLPIIQQIYGNWSVVVGNRYALSDVLELLHQPLPEYINNEDLDPIDFKEKVTLENISFRYDINTPWVFKETNIDIMKGSVIGIIGTTGSGKSTIVDILMGLLKPSTGRLLVDNIEIDSDAAQASWQRSIAHVPQSIYLSDSTIAENIAFGVPYDEIDFDLVKSAAERAQLSEFIDGRIKKYNEVVGERGVRLSGGQRQRIGIARALYKNAKIIVFDEATSALDDNTEKAVMETIDKLSSELTMIIIAHRISTLRNCSQIIEIKDGEIQIIGSYTDIAVKIN